MAAVATAHACAGPPETVLQPDKLLADFRIARLALEEGHSGIYRFTPKQTLDSLFDQAEKSLTRPMTVVEFYRVLRPVVAAIRCGHTDLAFPPGYAESLTARTGVLPLQVRVLGGTPYVLRDFSGGSVALAGKEIRSINGVPASKIVRQMLAVVSGDGDIPTVRTRRISGWAFSSQLAIMLGLQGPFEVRFWDSREKHEFDAHLEGPPIRELQEKARRQERQPQPLGQIRFLDEGAIAVMTIRGFEPFADREQKKPMAEFFQDSFNAIDHRHSRSLVLDLRDNGGGADELGKRLLSYLLFERFVYYEDLLVNSRQFRFREFADLLEIPADAVERLPSGKYRARNHPNLGVQQPARPTFSGRLFILMNGDCVSTTAEFLAQARFHRRATIIGEESGGAYGGNTSGVVPAVTLTNTKLRLYVPLVSYYMAVCGASDPRRGVLPDHAVEYSIDDLLKGSDKELALALALARRIDRD
jgi:hypothetical protein